MSTPLIFLDTETTGLDPFKHEVWELAYAVEDGQIHSHFLSHPSAYADPMALELNGYHQRWNPSGVSDPITERAVREVLTGATIVGSNPTFDTTFLRVRWGEAPWHHRLVNVAEGAMWVFGWDRPKGLADVVKELRSMDYDIPDPNHTAAGDVAVTREVYRALRTVQAHLGI